MRRLDTFHRENRRTYYMPDDTCVSITKEGISFYIEVEALETILWLPKGWGYVWNDMLET